MLDIGLFHTLAEAKVILADWIVAYNTEHPHSALGMVPSARFA
jgi:transposase InsO family protein